MFKDDVISVAATVFTGIHFKGDHFLKKIFNLFTLFVQNAQNRKFDLISTNFFFIKFVVQLSEIILTIFS